MRRKSQRKGNSQSVSNEKNSASNPKRPPSSGKKQSREKRGKSKNKKHQLQDYINSKICEICMKQDREHELLLCDRCDDSFHQYCLFPPIKELPQNEWICPICIAQIHQIQEKKLSMMKEEKTICYACKEPLNRKETIKGRDINNNPVQIECRSLVDLTCLCCAHNFHNTCFSERKNSLNCWTCQKVIRKNGPKSHEQFMNYIQQCIEENKHSQYCILQNKVSNEIVEQRNRFVRLKIPSWMTSWQFIVQNQASVYYAFKTKGLTFIDQQVYLKKDKNIIMNHNNPNKDVHGRILRLDERDEQVYEQFKINSKKGYVGPFQVKEDRVKGFYLVATDYIQSNTIVSQYVGEVMNSREALTYEDNDSIFLLVRGSRSEESLDIVPQKYGNISRFFSGINNSLKKSQIYKLENIKSLRFSYKGRVRLLLHTIKPVQAGETLYFDYNGSPFHEYPTDHFVN